MRKVIVASIAAAAALAMIAPASAHHNPGHTSGGCGRVPSSNPDSPNYRQETATVSGFYIYGDPSQPMGYQASNDIYLLVDGNPDDGDGVGVYAFQPYYDDRGVIKGPAWASVGVGTKYEGGVCNDSQPPSGVGLPE